MVDHIILRLQTSLTPMCQEVDVQNRLTYLLSLVQPGRDLAILTIPRLTEEQAPPQAPTNRPY